MSHPRLYAVRQIASRRPTIIKGRMRMKRLMFAASALVFAYGI
jgi:hypothetical protein